MDLGQSAGGLPPDDVVERTDAILASTESVVSRLHDGDMVNVVVAPCSPFSVTTELMRESALLARRLGLRLHTHLAETMAEERDCLARFGHRPLDVVDELGWLDRDVWYAHGVHFNASEIAEDRCSRGGRGPLPELERPAGVRVLPRSRPARRRRPGRARRRRRRLERGGRPSARS